MEMMKTLHQEMMEIINMEPGVQEKWLQWPLMITVVLE
jgi:hypothetical protein